MRACQGALALFFLALAAGCAGARAKGPDAPPPPESVPSAAQLVEIADVLATSGERMRAAQYLVLAEKQGVSERETLPRLLKLYAEDGQLRLAIEHAEHYLTRHPRDVRVRQCLASLYQAIGVSRAAVRELQRVVQVEPDNAEAHFALASILHESGTEHAETDEHYRAYLALEPEGRHAEEARSRLLTEVSP